MRMNAPVQFRPVCQTFTRDGEDKMKGARGMIGVPVGKQNARLSARWIALGNQVRRGLDGLTLLSTSEEPA